MYHRGTATYNVLLHESPAKKIQSKASCLPVSALQSARVGDNSVVLFAGQGPYLIIYLDGRKIVSRRVFEEQSIYGIRIASEVETQSTADLINVVVWGGGLVRPGRLTLGEHNGVLESSDVQLVLATEFDVKDWILDAAFLPGSIFILTAHNILVNVATTNDKIQINLDGEETSVIHGPGAFLYSGTLFIVNPDLVIVAAGTVFGEVLVWTCFRDPSLGKRRTSVKHVFTGHKGSVFGVAISQVSIVRNKPTRLLASCSDDRTIRLWDISDCDELSPDGSLNVVTTDTGFGSTQEGDQGELGSAWGHASRIWGVEFVTQMADNGAQRILLLSRGEDAMCQLWSVEAPSGLKTRDYRLVPLTNDRHHLGKNAWSMSQAGNNQDLKVFTGGADGQIISRHFGIRHADLAIPTTITTIFKNITQSSLALKHYCQINQNICFATTDQGDLYSITTERDELKCSHIYSSPQKGAILMCKVDSLGVLLLAQQQGDLFASFLKHPDALLPVKLNVPSGVCWMQVASPQRAGQTQGAACVVAAVSNGDAVVIWLTLEDGSLQAKYKTVAIPKTFVVTACAYDVSSGALLLGSRAGALAAYSNVTPVAESVEEPFCLRHVHGSDCVTSICVLLSPQSGRGFCEKTLHVLTTSRDGTFAIHQLDPSRLSLSMVHISTPSFGPNIEGAYLSPCKHPSGTSGHDLILYGFRATCFVVWNETQQSTILSVECGGAHRSWAYNDSVLSSSSTMKSKNDSGVVESTKSFIWTKAGKFNWYSMQEPDHSIIQRGGHGREIKAIAHSPRCLHGRPLLATGAEDTNIHLFTISNNRRDSDRLVSDSGIERQLESNSGNTTFQNIAVLKRHTTGLQHLLFSHSGEFLFSSAGCEEFYVWKLTFDVPHVDIGVVLWDMMPKEEDDADARIMSFDLQESKSPSTTNTDDPQEMNAMVKSFTLALAYSNGQTKVLRYIPSLARHQGKFEILQQIHYGSFCVMQASFLSPIQTQTQILSAGTNGYLNLGSLDETISYHEGSNISKHVRSSAMEVHKVHQSSILSMDILALDSETHLIATGGDDNALGLTVLVSKTDCTAQANPDIDRQDRLRHHFRTILIPRAHAAAVTGLRIGGTSWNTTGCAVTIVTVGNDQRVKVWKVHVDLKTAISSACQLVEAEVDTDRLFEAVQIDKVGSAWTPVADVSGLDIIRQTEIIEDESALCTSTDSHVTEDGCKIVVAGVGMDLLSVQLP